MPDNPEVVHLLNSHGNPYCGSSSTRPSNSINNTAEVTCERCIPPWLRLRVVCGSDDPRVHHLESEIARLNSDLTAQRTKYDRVKEQAVRLRSENDQLRADIATAAKSLSLGFYDPILTPLAEQLARIAARKDR